MTFSHYLGVGAKAADRLALVMCCLLLSAMVVLIGAQVVARYLIGSTLPWTEEVARHLMIWMLFVGIAPAYRRGAHLGVDFILDGKSNRMKAVILVFVVLVMALFALNMVVYGFSLSVRTMQQIASGLGYPIGYVYASVPIGGIFLILQTLARLPYLFKQMATGAEIIAQED